MIALLLFVLAATANLQGRVILEEERLGEEQQRCIAALISHPLTQSVYPELLNKERATRESEHFLLKIVQHCRCRIARTADELAMKYGDRLAWHFRDRRIELEREDQCALAAFKDRDLEIFYTIKVSTQMRRLVRDELFERSSPGLRKVASVSSMEQRYSCQERAILDECTRIKSLRLTYSCIREILNDPARMQKLSESCPGLKTDESESINQNDNYI